MANLIITTQCNNHCSFCFAREVPAQVPLSAHNMDRALFLDTLELLRKSNIDEVRLLGGEPSLHEDFAWFIYRSLEDGFRVVLFTNGLLSPKRISDLEEVDTKQLTVLVNCNLLAGHPPGKDSRQFEVFRRLGAKVLPGVTIDRPNTDLDFLIELINDFGLKKIIRLGLAHPALESDNDFLPPRWYPRVGEAITVFAEKAAQYDISLDFDCGFVPCMFPPEFFSLSGINRAMIGNCCGAIPDILPDGAVIPCYPLAGLTNSVIAADSPGFSEIRNQLDKHLEPFHSLGIYRECRSCNWRENHECSGGCLAAALQRWQQKPLNFTTGAKTVTGPAKAMNASYAYINMPESGVASAPDKARRWVIPYIDQPLEFWEELHAHYGDRIREVYFPLPGGPGSGRPLQPSRYLEDFISSAPFACSVLLNPVIIRGLLAETLTAAVDSLKGLQDRHELVGATVTNLLLAAGLKEALPELRLTASTLMDIASPKQLAALDSVFEGLVPASRIMRDRPALINLRQAFPGSIRLILNESCLPGCPLRVQHFYDMSYGESPPPSLCQDILRHHPWMSMTGSWVLPQHLYMFEGLYDELKLAGRVTMRDPHTYRKILAAYLTGSPLTPDQIGGGPASVPYPLEIAAKFFEYTLDCNSNCHSCSQCKNYYNSALFRFQNGSGSI